MEQIEQHYNISLIRNMHPSYESEVFGFNYPKSVCPSFLSIEGTSKGALPGGFKTQNSTGITMQTAILCLCRGIKKCKYSSILRKENDFNFKVLK